MTTWIDIALNADTLAALGLPDIPYPFALEHLDRALAGGGTLPFADILAALREQHGDTPDDPAVSAAMHRLAELAGFPTHDTPTLRARIRGCLLAGAMGDALGAPVEFMHRDEILRRFGSRGITRYAPAYGRSGAITDDTQMTLFTAEGLLRAFVHDTLFRNAHYPGIAAQALLRWLHTQGEACDPAFDPDLIRSGWLVADRRLHARRAPGNTCLASLRAMQRWDQPAHNNSKGCGGVMRMAPVGVFALLREDEQPLGAAFELGTILAAQTHGHPSGNLSAGAFAVMIAALVAGCSLSDALRHAKTLLRTATSHEEVLAALEHAERLAASGGDRHACIRALGQGWVAEEALAIGVYCALVAEDVEDGIVLAVNHDGDSDSTGAIAGNLLGAIHGEETLPAAWREELELSDVITTIADDLHDFPSWFRTPDGDGFFMNAEVIDRYPA